MVIDTHLHLIGSDKEKFPLNLYPHPGHEWVAVSPNSDEYLLTMKNAGVDKALLVQPHAAYQTDNSYICSVSSKHKEIFAIAIIDPENSASQNTIRQFREGEVVGLRLFSIPSPTISWIGAPEKAWIWHQAQKQRLVMSVCILPNELKEIAKCAEFYDEQIVVVDHCGFAPIFDQSDPISKNLLELARYPNVVLKVTTLVIYSWIQNKGSIAGLFPLLAESFGVERLVWGSDFAQTNDRTYKELVDLGLKAMDSLGSSSEAPKSLNAQRIWALGETSLE